MEEKKEELDTIRPERQESGNLLAQNFQFIKNSLSTVSSSRQFIGTEFPIYQEFLKYCIKLAFIVC